MKKAVHEARSGGSQGQFDASGPRLCPSAVELGATNDTVCLCRKQLQWQGMENDDQTALELAFVGQNLFSVILMSPATIRFENFGLLKLDERQKLTGQGLVLPLITKYK